MRGSIAVLAVTAVTAFGGVVPAEAAASDTEAPVVRSMWISHQTIDVVDGPVQVTVRVEVEDQGTGLDLESPSLNPGNVLAHDAVPGQVMTLISGDRFHGTYESTFTFPEFVTSGNWYIRPYVRDRAGNWEQRTPARAEVLVVSLEDKDAPTMTAALKSSRTVGLNILDITDGPATVEVTATAYDEGIGFGVDSTASISGGGWGSHVANSSTDPNQATFTTTFTYPQHIHREPREWYDIDRRGVYTYEVGLIADANGNWVARHTVGRLVVATRPMPDERPPQLHISDGTVTAVWPGNHDLLGVLEYEVEFADTDTENIRTVRTSGTQASLDDLPAGMYTSRVRARNELGWGEWTKPSEPAVHTGAATPVTRTPATSTDTDGTVQDSHPVPVTAGVDSFLDDQILLGDTHAGLGTVSPGVRGDAAVTLDDPAATSAMDKDPDLAVTHRSPTQPPIEPSVSPAPTIHTGASSPDQTSKDVRAEGPMVNYGLALAVAVLVLTLSALFSRGWRQRINAGNNQSAPH
jgi:hypothetical protein